MKTERQKLHDSEEWHPVQAYIFDLFEADASQICCDRQQDTDQWKLQLDNFGGKDELRKHHDNDRQEICEPLCSAIRSALEKTEPQHDQRGGKPSHQERSQPRVGHSDIN